MSLHLIYLIAITAEAMTGALAAGRRGMDLFGVVTIACVTALGGGSLRDIVLGHYPLGWVCHPQYLAYTAGAAILALLIAPAVTRLRRVFLCLDALGMVAFTLIGGAIARDMALPASIVIIAGMLTGTSGGVLRDVLCNEVPLVFQRELYASISLLTGLAYVGLLDAGVDPRLTTLACLIGGFTLRLLAILRQWEMPRFGHLR